MRGSVLCLLLCLAVWLSGCGGPDPKAPPEVRWGQEACAFCRMVIEDPRFAAAYRLRTGEQRAFDDIGDLLQALAREKEPVASVWIHDFDSERWLPAGSAYLVLSPAIESPMGYGLLGVDSEARAREIAGAGGEVLTWDKLRERGVRPPR